jgi:hypothetical protein
MKKIINQKFIPSKAEIKNDMIRKVCIRRDRGFILGLDVEFESGRQPMFGGYQNTENIGSIILCLADLLGVNKSGECSDILKAFEGVPCRIASIDNWGAPIAENTWIGHFMKDKWMNCKDVVLSGIEKDEQAKGATK